MTLSFKARVTDVFERKIRKHHGGAGPEARFSTASEGWYIQLDEMISIFAGRERPKFEDGDEIVISIRKVT